MDYFAGLTNEDFMSYFLVDLNCRMELIQYVYPHELFEPDEVIDDHIVRCQGILHDYLRKVVKDTLFDTSVDLTTVEIEKMVHERFKELIPLMLTVSEKYYNEVVVHYVHLSGNETIEDEDRA